MNAFKQNQKLGPNEFRCTNCGGVYEKDWSDEEAKKEYDDLYPTIPFSEAVIVCDECYKKIMNSSQEEPQ